MNWQTIIGPARGIARRDDGQDLIEYAMLGSLIAIAVMVAIRTFGTFIKAEFWDVVSSFI